MFYRYLKEKGIHDDHIILMNPTDHACNSRNVFPGTLYSQKNHDQNWMCDDVEIDYKAQDISSEAIMNMLRGRFEPDFPISKRL